VGLYRLVLAATGVKRLVAATYAGALSVGVNGLAILLFAGQASGSLSVGAVVTGLYSFGRCLGTPIQGRLIDARTPAPVLGVLTAVHLAAMLLLLGAGELGGSAFAMGLAALAAGFAHPSLLSVLRSLWPIILGDAALLRAAYAIDAVLIDVVFVSGPLIVTLLATSVSVVAALLASLALMAVGAALFVTAPAVRNRPGNSRGPMSSSLSGALASVPIRLITISSVPLGFLFGTIEVGLTGFAQGLHDPRLAGLFVGCWALGSVGGGLVYGATTRSSSLNASYLRNYWICAAGSLLMLAGSGVASMMALAALSGTGVAPMLASMNQYVTAIALPGTETEAYTWPLTALIGGIGLGAIAAGALAGEGWRTALASGSAVALAGAVFTQVAISGRRPPEAERSLT
jgi:hypothetical protein